MICGGWRTAPCGTEVSAHLGMSPLASLGEEKTGKEYGFPMFQSPWPEEVVSDMFGNAKHWISLVAGQGLGFVFWASRFVPAQDRNMAFQ